MMIGIGIGITAGVGRSVSLFNRVHQELFGSGEQGIYMPSVHESFLRGDLYQDAAGTTPAALGQQVGLWLDRSRELMLGPELMAGWESSGNWTSIVDVTFTGSEMVFAAISARTWWPVQVGKWYALQISRTDNGVLLRIDDDGVGAGQGSVTTYAELRNSGKAIFKTTGSTHLRLIQAESGDPIAISNISVRELPGNHASQPTAASRPTLQQDANGMYVLRFDGVDDWMVTPSIDFTGTDKMTALAGVRRSADGTYCVIELGPIVDTTNGTFTLFHASSPYGRAMLAARSSAFINTTAPGSFPLSDPTVFTGLVDFSRSGTAGVIALRRDGAVVATGTGNTGTGNFTNQPLNIGARTGTNFFLNGDIYGLIVCGAEKTLAQIERAESLINKYTRAYS